MCKGSKIEMACGHVETHFSSLCGRKCSSPQGPTTYLDTPCPRCDPENIKKKHEDRAAELMTQLMGSRHAEGAVKVTKLTERMKELNLSAHRGVAEAKYLMHGAPSSPQADAYSGHSWNGKNRNSRAPWDPDSDSESDDGRRDTSHLTEDGKHVIQKQYKLINGHWALITFRRELDEVEPLLLIKLQEKREKALAMSEAKKKKREERKRAKNGERCAEELKKEAELEKAIREEEEMPPWRPTGPALSEKNTELTKPMDPEPRKTLSMKKRQTRSQELLEEVKKRIHEEPYEEPSPPPSPPLIAEIIRKASLTQRPSAIAPKPWRKNSRQAQISSSSPSSSGSCNTRVQRDEPRPPMRQSGGQALEQRREPIQEEEQAQYHLAEGPAAPARRYLLRKNGHASWVEKYAEDITYASSDSESDASIHRAPELQSSWKGSKGRSPGQSNVVENEKDLDIWQRISDQSDKGKAPLHRGKSNRLPSRGPNKQ
ncbi:hypothetical protein F5Y19DRAFT_490552 [Xylariaceae sp. FL1651]|nr:hypothetical protein F5Y19DRAFT_490552 [Xylariaceae sp. FL1651]